MNDTSREAERILREYERRDREKLDERYSLTRPAALYLHQQRVRALLGVLRGKGVLPLEGKRILDVGCGGGDGLADFETFGASREQLAGIELSPERAGSSGARLRGADIREGDASELPWGDGSFDIVAQSTVFSSILDREMKCAVAAEMARVLAPRGAIIWCDFFVNNPWNGNVRGIGISELRALFPGFVVARRRVMLAAPIARSVVPISWVAALLLEKCRLFCTHYLAVLERNSGGLGRV